MYAIIIITDVKLYLDWSSNKRSPNARDGIEMITVITQIWTLEKYNS